MISLRNWNIRQAEATHFPAKWGIIETDYARSNIIRRFRPCEIPPTNIIQILSHDNVHVQVSPPVSIQAASEKLVSGRYHHDMCELIN